MSMLNIGMGECHSILDQIQPGDTQPNAVDLRLDKVLEIYPTLFVIDEQQKVHRGSEELIPDEDGYFTLRPGTYEVTMENTISVARGEAGFVITRSTLNRNGVFLTSGLYDSGYGYDGDQRSPAVMAAAMHVTTGPMKIRKGTRIGQYVGFYAETNNMYDGDYGSHKAHDKKYL